MLKEPSNLECCKCKTKLYVALLRYCSLLNDLTCVDCCAKCMFCSGITGKCEYRSGGK